MNISEAFKALGDQHIEEQGLITRGWADVKGYLADFREKRHIDSIKREIEKNGISALKDSPFNKNEEVVSYAIYNERLFGGFLMAQSQLTNEAKSEQEHIRSLASPSRDACGEPMKYVSPECPNYRNIAEYVVSNFGGNLDHLSDELRANKQIVMKAVSHRAELLEHASTALKDDPDVLLAAIQFEHYDESTTGIKFASDRLKNDKAFAMEFLARSGDSLPAFSEEIRADRDCVMVAVKAYPLSLKSASKELRDDRGVALEALKNCDPQDWQLQPVLSYASPAIQAMAGKSNEVANLKDGIEKEKFSQSLEHKLAVKKDAPTKKIKI